MPDRVGFVEPVVAPFQQDSILYAALGELPC